MVAHATTMTPFRIKRALELRSQGLCVAYAARQMGIPVATLQKWAKVNDVKFPDGRGQTRAAGPRSEAFIAAARRSVVKAREAAAAKSRLPLNDEERRLYKRIRAEGRGLVTRDDAFRAIGRADLAVTP